MHTNNLVVLRGRVSSTPRLTTLPSGSTLAHLEVTTRVDDAAVSTPVAWFEPTASFDTDDEVVVLGQVRRRFFRAGGTTASRTEVVAERVVRADRRREVQRLVGRALVALGGDG